MPVSFLSVASWVAKQPIRFLCTSLGELISFPSPSCDLSEKHKVPRQIGTNVQISYTLHPLPVHTRAFFLSLNGAAGLLRQQFTSAGSFSWLSPMQSMLSPPLLLHNQESCPPAGANCPLKPLHVSQEHLHFPDLCFAEPLLSSPALPGSAKDGQHFWPSSNSFISTLALPIDLLLFGHLTLHFCTILLPASVYISHCTSPCSSHY